MYSDHEFVSSVTKDESSKEGTCINTILLKNGREKVCGLSWTSVLHPPDQFRHWCSALEAGYDCMHFEMDSHWETD